MSEDWRSESRSDRVVHFISRIAEALESIDATLRGMAMAEAMRGVVEHPTEEEIEEIRERILNGDDSVFAGPGDEDE